jgi:large conductance mechanosensitive channel
MHGFITFIREQGVVGLAIGFILGGAVSKLVSSLVTNIINPLIGLIVPNTTSLATATFTFGSSIFNWGGFVTTLIDFIVIAGVVYYGFKMLKLDSLDKKKGA